ncbi:MAG: histidine kinase [Alistipes sp.]|nr:histidine kinase [Candidatus Alistipes equi]
MAFLNNGPRNIRKQHIGENLLYTLIWSLVFLIPIMNAKLMSEEHVNFANVFVAWIKISPFFCLFLIHNIFYLELLLKKKKVYLYTAVSLATLVITFMSVEMYERWNTSLNELCLNQIQPHHASLTDLEWYWNIFLGIFMFLANMGFKVLYLSMQQDEDIAKLRKEKLEVELAGLKHQINPHFFMNTLNNIHALIDIDHKMAKQSIIELSEMMRYVVYDSCGDRITLRKELNFINNYIFLMKLRYLEDVDIKFTYPQNISSKIFIPPLILIVFIENAFKHGISYDFPSFVHISIEMKGQMVEMMVENTIAPVQKSAVHTDGIGIENTRKRLNLIYNDQYSIDIKEESTYRLTLKIPALSNDYMYSN